MKFAFILSRFNEEVTNGLLKGAMDYLDEKEISYEQIDIFYAPGSFEIPLLAQTAANTKRYSGIICLGSVIKGETAHFEFISLGNTVGLMQSMLQHEVPMSFGILTAYSQDQAKERSQPHDQENKGREAAAACYETIQEQNRIRKPDQLTRPGGFEPPTS